MVSQVARVETTVDALRGRGAAAREQPDQGLEPRYNILFRDDKSYPYLCITGRRVSAAALPPRRARPPPPLLRAVSAAPARCARASQLLQKVFQLRTCENTVFANRSRPCMLHQIQRCTAPCVGADRRGASTREDVAGADAVPARARATRCSRSLHAQMDARPRRLDVRARPRAFRDKIARAAARAVAPVRRSATAARRRRGRRGHRGRARRA